MGYTNPRTHSLTHSLTPWQTRFYSSGKTIQSRRLHPTYEYYSVTPLQREANTDHPTAHSTLSKQWHCRHWGMRNDSVCYDLYLLNTTTYLLLLLLLLLSFYSHSTACVSQHPELGKPLEKPEDFVGVKSYCPRARMLTPELRFVYFPSRRTSDIVIHTAV